MKVKEVLQRIDEKIAYLEALPSTDYRNGALIELEELRYRIRRKGGEK